MQDFLSLLKGKPRNQISRLIDDKKEPTSDGAGSFLSIFLAVLVQHC